MSVFVGAIRSHWFVKGLGNKSCHMMADTDTELEEMARTIKLRPSWRHGDHYDISPRRRRIAIKNGAVVTTDIALVYLRWERRLNET